MTNSDSFKKYHDALEERAQHERFDHLVRGQPDHHRPAVGHTLDQSLGFEPCQRFTHWHPAHTQLCGQFGLRQPSARSNLPRDDRIANAFCHMLGGAPRPCQLINAFNAIFHVLTPHRYYAARTNGSTAPGLLRSWGRLSPLHTAERKGSALPPSPTERGGPPPLLGLSPGLCGSGVDCRLFYAPHSASSADAVRLGRRRAQSKPYSRAGFVTSTMWRAAASGSHSPSASARSPSFGICGALG